MRLLLLFICVSCTPTTQPVMDLSGIYTGHVETTLYRLELIQEGRALSANLSSDGSTLHLEGFVDAETFTLSNYFAQSETLLELEGTQNDFCLNGRFTKLWRALPSSGTFEFKRVGTL